MKTRIKYPEISKNLTSTVWSFIKRAQIFLLFSLLAVIIPLVILESHGILFSFFILLFEFIIIFFTPFIFKDLIKLNKFKRELKREDKILKSLTRDSFHIILKDKNFLNHHNYFNSQKKQKSYKRSLLKKSILFSIKTGCIMSFVFFVTILFQTIDQEHIFQAAFSISGVIFIIWSIIGVISSLFNYYRKIHRKIIKIFQTKNTWDKYVETKNKVFFY